jgi:transcriptional regulator with XRE-family HTH domain
MTDILSTVEKRRISLGQTQAAVAAACGITQPHYSKVVGGLVGLTGKLEERLNQWLQGNPSHRETSELDSEILTLTREIASKSKRLAVILARSGKAPPRRQPRNASRKGQA